MKIKEDYTHLYEHLQQMQHVPTRSGCLDQINKLYLSDLSEIVLESREAIIRHVNNGIPKDYRGPIVFILGGTGSGKSTTLCFLRGDEMVLDGFSYISKNDTGEYIGRESAKSKTLLPNIETLDNLILVDFPGFDDSNGFLVDLGVELALKTLLKEYNPKILFLEPIGNVEGRCSNIEKDGIRLSQLIENKSEVCVLGLTKYANDPNESLIKSIEKQQSEALSKPDIEELKLIGVINALNAIPEGTNGTNSVDLKQLIAEKEKELHELQQKKATLALLPSDDTPEKQQCRESIKNTEDELLKLIGLKKLIRFKELENSEQLEATLQELSSYTPPISIKQGQQSKSDSEMLFDKLLRENFLKNKIYAPQSSKGFAHFNDSKSFEAVVLEHSLLYAICPDIGKLLHLPEINPCLVESLDLEIITTCLNNYIKGIVSLNINLVKQQLLTKENNCKELEQNLTTLENYIKRFLGLEDKSWDDYQQQHFSASFKDSYQAPSWLSNHSYLKAASPTSLYSLKNSLVTAKKGACIQEELLNHCKQEVTQVLGTLQCLVKIKLMLENKKSFLIADEKPLNLPGLNALYRLLTVQIEAAAPEKQTSQVVNPQMEDNPLSQQQTGLANRANSENEIPHKQSSDLNKTKESDKFLQKERSETKQTTCCSPLCMQVLGGFIAALGVAAVALAFILINPVTFGVVVGVGIGVALIGLSFFAGGTYRNSQSESNQLDLKDSTFATINKVGRVL